MSSRVVVRLGTGGDADRARALATRLGAPFAEGDCGAARELSLVVDALGLSLSDGDMELRGDFTHMLTRIRPGAVQRELVVRAAKVKERQRRGGSHGATSGRLLVVDATAGLGEDSLLLAASGANVVLYEHNPVIAALLEDALRRGAQVPDLAEAIGRMRLVEGDSVRALRNMASGASSSLCAAGAFASCDGVALPDGAFAPDVVLLDPMFPARRKSASVKKKLQLLQQLESPCANEAALLDAAIAAHPRKVVVKRPPKGPYLAGVKPSYSLTGKAVRYDCIALPD